MLHVRHWERATTGWNNKNVPQCKIVTFLNISSSTVCNIKRVRDTKEISVRGTQIIISADCGPEVLKPEKSLPVVQSQTSNLIFQFQD